MLYKKGKFQIHPTVKILQNAHKGLCNNQPKIQSHAD